MIPRHIAPYILKYAKQYPIVALVGPRQSGKTTLSQSLFPNYRYVSLENLDYRHHATDDPRGFLDEFGPYAIFDEVQRVPELFSYLQQCVDEDATPGQYILTGSSQFLLMETITQSLAGRIITFRLYPLTFSELYGYPADTNHEKIFQQRHPTHAPIAQEELLRLLFTGLYPRVHDRHLDSYKWYENYTLTYLERDVRSLLNVQNLRTFESFLKLCASQSGQLLNYSSMANALGMSVSTIKQWVSILESSGIIFILPPYYKNLSKRLVKTPKLYFVDTGILCYLLSIREESHLRSHPLLGSIFETFIVNECFKRLSNMGEIPSLYFWRDQTGNEIDLLINHALSSFPIEIKLSQTFQNDFKKSIERWLNLPENPSKKGMVIYCGEHAMQTTSPIPTVPWYQL